MVKYKQRCMRCKKNYVAVSGWGSRGRPIICYDCEKKDLEGEVKDPVMKKFFHIPEDFYKRSAFLRSIKINYLRYGALTENQIAAFKKAVAEMKDTKDE